MINLQNEFLTFHDSIKLDDENATLRSKRDILLNKLAKNISEEAASYTHFNQGSYAMGTGIKPEKGDYDIDVGLKFNIDKADYDDPIDVKKWVKDALDVHTKSVKIRRSCVTVTYQEDGEDAYHVDFAVYANNNEDGEMYIAKGKENSLPENKYWEISCPQELISEINGKYEDADDRAQFKRVIRYLKKWKSNKFLVSGNLAPTGIALTILAYKFFQVSKKYDPYAEKYVYDDFSALKTLINKIKWEFQPTYDVDDDVIYYTIKTGLIVKPYNNLFEKMTNKQMDDFYNKVVECEELLEEVVTEGRRDKACEILRKIWGDDFPITYDRSMVGTSESA